MTKIEQAAIDLLVGLEKLFTYDAYKNIRGLLREELETLTEAIDEHIDKS